jgi:hypothetical protein
MDSICLSSSRLSEMNACGLSGRSSETYVGSQWQPMASCHGRKSTSIREVMITISTDDSIMPASHVLLRDSKLLFPSQCRILESTHSERVFELSI